MRFSQHVALTLAAVVLTGCGGDRITPPADEAARAAAALERAAAETGLDGDPTTITYRSVAAALRAGAPFARVEISVDGDPQPWYAFANEIRFLPTAGSEPTDLFGDSEFRSLIAWRATDTRVQVIQLITNGRSGNVGGPWPGETADGVGVDFPSVLIYSEGRNLLWDAVRGTQTNAIVETSSTPCPTPRRPAGVVGGPTCVLATFSFSFSDVEAEPASFVFGPNGPVPSAATGTRRLSMAPQRVEGTATTIDFPTILP